MSDAASGRTNGTSPIADSAIGDDDLDDDSPLDEAEAAAAAAVADQPADRSLAELVDSVIEDLGGVERSPGPAGLSCAVNGRTFAVYAEDRLETALEPSVAKAALRTPDTSESPRGTGWVAFAPASIDRFALDRAEAWVRSAYRRAAGEADRSG